jgi:hypothetical protein
MSVLHLRRDMVVVEEEPVVEIETPFPLRTIDAEITEIVGPDNDDDEAPRRSLFGALRFWFNALIVAVMLAAYPAMVMLSSDVGDRNVSGMVDRTGWAAPWAGGAATLMEKHFGELGWASDAPSWSPMARLTAKPAYQSAMAGSIGEFVVLANAQANALDKGDPDLAAAARLVSGSSNGVQLRAARDALANFDRRLRRRGTAFVFTATQIGEQLALIDTWAVKGQEDIAKTSAVLGGSPIDESATVAVYRAKGMAMTAFVFLDAMQWPDTPAAAAARTAALDAWKEAAEFHPLIVLNGSPDGSVFGNHAASMGFLVAQAQKATRDYIALVGTPGPAVGNLANAAPVGSLD